MESWLHSSIFWLLSLLALPRVGLSAIFIISLVSATLLPLGSEPAVFGFVKLAPDMFWPAVLVATAGNTLGGMISYFMGLGAHKAYERWRETHGHAHAGLSRAELAARERENGRRVGGRWHAQISAWAHRWGPASMLFSWLPVVGDPLCAVGGWLRFSLWPCVAFMAVGKFLRYVVMTLLLLHWFPGSGG